MKLEELIQLMDNKKTVLNNQLNAAYTAGDIAEYHRVEAEVKEVEKIIEKLRA